MISLVYQWICSLIKMISFDYGEKCTHYYEANFVYVLSLITQLLAGVIVLAMCLMFSFEVLFFVIKEILSYFNIKLVQCYETPDNVPDEKMWTEGVMSIIISYIYNSDPNEYVESFVRDTIRDQGCQLINIPLRPRFYTVFHLAVMRGSLELVELMLNNGADISLKNLQGDSLMYLATHRISKMTSELEFNTNKRLLECLFTVGCDVNIANVFGFTPLHVAARAGNLFLIKWLVEKGADPNLRNIQSLKRPIDIARQFDSDLHKKVVAYLKQFRD